MSNDRAIAAWAAMHERYLQDAHPEAWESLRASGELAEHCHRRGIEAVEMAEGTELQMARDCLDRGDIIGLHTTKTVTRELVEDFVRAL